MALLKREHLPRIADPGSGEGADRPRRDRVDADGGRPEISTWALTMSAGMF
jgi:hypothetical protein